MSKRVLSCLVAVTTISGCAGFCAPDMTNACSSSPEVHNHYYIEDDSSSEVMLAVGVTVAVAALIGVIAMNSKDDDRPRPPTLGTPPSAQAAYMVPVPVPMADNDDEVRLQRMYMQGHLSARAGRCESTVVIGRQLARVSPSFHQQYVADPTIAACLR